MELIPGERLLPRERLRIRQTRNHHEAGWTVNGFNDLPTPNDLTVFACCSPNVTG
jgi:hypothetical protein